MWKPSLDYHYKNLGTWGVSSKLIINGLATLATTQLFLNFAVWFMKEGGVFFILGIHAAVTLVDQLIYVTVYV